MGPQLVEAKSPAKESHRPRASKETRGKARARPRPKERARRRDAKAKVEKTVGVLAKEKASEEE